MVWSTCLVLSASALCCTQHVSHAQVHIFKMVSAIPGVATLSWAHPLKEENVSTPEFAFVKKEIHSTYTALSLMAFTFLIFQEQLILFDNLWSQNNAVQEITKICQRKYKTNSWLSYQNVSQQIVLANNLWSTNIKIISHNRSFFIHEVKKLKIIKYLWRINS